jgi:hypothetical protein
MIVVVIVGGMLLGYGIGQYIVDRYINESQREINGTQSKVNKNELK